MIRPPEGAKYIEMADHLVDLGPGAGSAGGEIMFEGDYAGLYASDTVTGRMLRSRKEFRSSGSRADLPGNTLFLIEHSTDVMKEADWLIELGPEGGEAGGKLLYSGIPSEILNCSASVTAPWLEKP